MSNEQMVSVPFKREDRYIVIKRSDLKNVPVNYRSHLVDPMFSLLAHLPHRECLVIESDWPEYEPAWAAIEARVTGRPTYDGFSAGDMADQGAKAFAARDGEVDQLRAERDQLQADLTARDEENDELRNGLVRIIQVTSLGEAAFSIACEVLGELDAKALPDDEVQS
ncbi:hypothetical protein [Pseudomonas donghuensis]|uniref:hypothetical protein n=1 Tax=Pseudomonas donghuensis TaxID=1163398 RepID=UPI00215E57D0|nr:hypothetical protein [Pseudomonas donghuensis]UVL22430.1 hypothetical protein LOY30_16340 [Pseudomonas donghuensis]